MPPHSPNPTLNRRIIQRRNPPKVHNGMRHIEARPVGNSRRGPLRPEVDCAREDGEEGGRVRVVGEFGVGEGGGAEDEGEVVVG